MSIEQVLAAARSLEGVAELAPAPGSDAPEIAWGDHFFYYAPDGRIPDRVQPYATVVTKDYPDDTRSDLDAPGRFRVNIQLSKAKFTELLGHDASARDLAEADVLLPHPVYGAASWIAVVNPGPRTLPTVVELLAEAHEAARRRAERRE